MRPKKKRTGSEQPDAIKEEIDEAIGGTDGEEMGEDEDWGKSESDSLDYGRLRDLEEDKYV